MKAILCGLCLFFLAGCTNGSSTQFSGDCRNEGQGCTGNFSCQRTEAALYECLPNEGMPHSDGTSGAVEAAESDGVVELSNGNESGAGSQEGTNTEGGAEIEGEEEPRIFSKEDSKHIG